ncbi:MAG: class I SAM-dependent methyltransferase [Ornithinimicrobium sp.]
MTTETLYDTTRGVEDYAVMAEGYDGRTHIERLNQLLPPGSAVLELGMGPGVDLDMLARTFTATGSDRSQAFLDRYARIRPETELLRLDAVTLDTDRHFDAIYSNKVLHHLTRDELITSLERQARLLRPGGLLLHGIWAGMTTETHEGLHDQRYTPDTLRTALPASLALIECDFYQEMTHNDSLRVLLHPADTRDDT